MSSPDSWNAGINEPRRHREAWNHNDADAHLGLWNRAARGDVPADTNRTGRRQGAPGRRADHLEAA